MLGALLRWLRSLRAAKAVVGEAERVTQSDADVQALLDRWGD